ncbi:putative membrane protein [Herbihabitans rhizosphaerae]|uniref:Putative membrane protein n=1 Tax=Herbihabitans rhizosphaerae TaxID=1872711 RepID=A0A4Q7KX08_9PSEU|nr:hypothetical protein [Herbihabitans rhizosphaerae]RZS41245.1 putative membrane protein [Herbihabitans rhizosphaerae]
MRVPRSVRAAVVLTAAVTIPATIAPVATATGLPPLPFGVSITVTDLGTLPGAPSGIAHDVTDRGLVVGVSGNEFDGTGRAVGWRAGRGTDLGSGVAYQANERGQVVGTARTATTTSARLWHQGTEVDLTPGRTSTADQVNERGDVLVDIRPGDGQPRRLGRWRDGALTELAIPGPASESLERAVLGQGGHIAGSVRHYTGTGPSYGFNCSGQVCSVLPPLDPAGDKAVTVVAVDPTGTVYGTVEGAAGKSTAVRWTGDRVTPIASPESESSVVAAVSPRGGHVTGMSVRPDGGVRGFRLHDGRFTDLGDAAATGSPHVVNDLGDVVLSRMISLYEVRASLWRHGRTWELPTLGGQFAGVRAINNNGVIVGMATAGPAFTPRPVQWTVPWLPL